jgi:DNA-binding MarR family transcriptional regulator
MDADRPPFTPQEATTSRGTDRVLTPMTDPLFSRLLQVANSLQHRLESELREVGLSAAKLAVLEQLDRAARPLPLRMLAEEQGCVPSNITTLVGRLEGAGLLRRMDDPDDRRTVLAVLTPLGAQRLSAGLRRVAEVQATFDAALRPAEHVALARILASLGRAATVSPAPVEAG